MTQRMERVQKLARQVLGELITELKDPRVGFTTVTAVKVTPDLRHARVFVSVLGTPEERELTMKGLESAKPRLRSALGHEMRMKYTPELVFELDEVVESAGRIEALLHKIHEEEGS
ncbi:MAG TPA: 30S ribosome-binding factor RbfA [Actinomycetota bacterium]|nr:30S ribosome-binding factor RbfA [Actinomycetota bacterium]